MDQNIEVAKEPNDQEVEPKEEDAKARLRKQKGGVLNRSDSTGSTGRKYLAPTLSDPQRNEKERFSGSKKKSPRQTVPSQKNSLQHFPELSQPHCHGGHNHDHQQPNKSFASTGNGTMVTEVTDWWQEQMMCGHSSSDEE